MGWNRERITFVLSALVLLGSILHAAGSFLGGDATSIQLQEPAPAQRGIVGGRVTIDWYQGEGGAIRDPYQAKSDWRSGAMSSPMSGNLWSHSLRASRSACGSKSA